MVPEQLSRSLEPLIRKDPEGLAESRAEVQNPSPPPQMGEHVPILCTWGAWLLLLATFTASLSTPAIANKQAGPLCAPFDDGLACVVVSPYDAKEKSRATYKHAQWDDDPASYQAPVPHPQLRTYYRGSRSPSGLGH